MQSDEIEIEGIEDDQDSYLVKVDEIAAEVKKDKLQLQEGTHLHSLPKIM